MKKLLLVAVALLFCTTTFAQSTADNVILKGTINFASMDGGKSLGGSIEKGIAAFDDDAFITLGGYLGYDDNCRLMVQGNYYFAPMVENLDVYAGMRWGYAISKGLAYSVQAGANYWFADWAGAMVEVGYGVAIVNVGLTVRF